MPFWAFWAFWSISNIPNCRQLKLILLNIFLRRSFRRVKYIISEKTNGFRCKDDSITNYVARPTVVFITLIRRSGSLKFVFTWCELYDGIFQLVEGILRFPVEIIHLIHAV